ncbi:MAG: BON domain-containing protein [Alphaproteobacteria bacterium]|nr:MAG: BON domain-containing protein [Alphaproteobacteria bacterium]
MPRNVIKKCGKTFSKAGKALSLCLIALTLSGCTPTSLALSGGTAVGVAAAREGGLKVAATDTAIRLQIHDLWFRHDFDMYRKLSLTVREGRALITGTVPDPDMRVDAVRLAWLADGVREVINEVNVDDPTGVRGYLGDSLITAGIKTRLTFDKDVQSINYTVDTVDNVVYLMGVAQNESELGRAIDHARRTKGVSNVISYVRLRGEMPPALTAAPAKPPEFSSPARQEPAIEQAQVSETF